MRNVLTLSSVYMAQVIEKNDLYYDVFVVLAVQCRDDGYVDQM